jgi:hypothetical protein
VLALARWPTRRAASWPPIGSAWPISSVWAIGTLVGVSMFFSGITRLMLSVAVRRIVA